MRSRTFVQFCSKQLCFNFSRNCAVNAATNTKESTEPASEYPPPLQQTRSVTPTNSNEPQPLKPLGKLDETTYGKVDVSKWNITVDGTNATIKSYTGDKKQIVVPTLKDLQDYDSTKDKYKSVTSLGIKLDTLSGLINKNNTETIAISHNGNPVKMLDITLMNLFEETNLRHIDLANLDTSSVESLSRTFWQNKQLLTIDGIERWNVSNVTNLYDLFSECESLQKLPDLSRWNTSKVTNMSYTFRGLKVSDKDFSFLSNWNTSNVTTMEYMFAECNQLESVKQLSNWDTSKVTNMEQMFMNTKVRDLSPLSNWKVNNVTNMHRMFYGSDGIKDFSGLSKWNINNNANINEMFSDLSGTLIAKDWQSVSSSDNKLFKAIFDNMARGGRYTFGAVFITDAPFAKNYSKNDKFDHHISLYKSLQDYYASNIPLQTYKMPAIYYSAKIDSSNKAAQRKVVLDIAREKVNNWIKAKEEKDHKNKYKITYMIIPRSSDSENDPHLVANTSFIIEKVEATKTITQTITVHDQPDEPEYTIIRKREIYRTFEEKDGKKVLSPWSKAVFKAFTLPQIEGYSVDPIKEVTTDTDVKADAYYVKSNKPKPNTPPSSTPTTTDTGTQTEPEPKKPDEPEKPDKPEQHDTPEPQKTDKPQPEIPNNTGMQNNPIEPRIVYVPSAPEAQEHNNDKNNAAPACHCDCKANNSDNGQPSEGSNNSSGNKQAKTITGSLAKTGATTQSIALLLLLITTAVGSFLLGRIRSKQRKHAAK